MVLFDFISNQPSEYETRRPLKIFKACIGRATNNIAEYSALIKSLEIASKEFPVSVLIFMDSLLVIQQMKGVFKVKDPHLKKLFLKAKGLESKFKKVEFMHIPREKNQLADKLAKEAIKGATV